MTAPESELRYRFKEYDSREHMQSPSSSSLSDRRMEVAIPRGTRQPRSSLQYEVEELLPAPLKIVKKTQPQKTQNERARSWEAPLTQEATTGSLRMLAHIDTEVGSTHSQPNLKKSSREAPKTHAMTKSSHKILQLTGFDPRFEKTLPLEHQQTSEPRPVSPVPSTGSASIYSQPGKPYDYTQEKSHWSDGSSSPAGSHTDILQTFSDHIAGAFTSVSSLRYRDRPAKARRPVSNPDPRQVVEEDQNEVTTLKEILAQGKAQEEARFSYAVEDDIGSNFRHEARDPSMEPAPLNLPPRKKTKPVSLNLNKSSLLQNARESFEWGMYELTSPKTKHFNTPITPLFDEGNLLKQDIPSPVDVKRKKTFGTGKHPLKSPFPFRQIKEAEEESPTESESVFSKVKRTLSISPTEQRSSSFGARKPEGSEGPALKSAFKTLIPAVEATLHKGNVRFQETVGKAKKSVQGKSAEEKKRESLKKSIVVVGISDQNPGMSQRVLGGKYSTNCWQMAA